MLDWHVSFIFIFLIFTISLRRRRWSCLVWPRSSFKTNTSSSAMRLRNRFSILFIIHKRVIKSTEISRLRLVSAEIINIFHLSENSSLNKCQACDDSALLHAYRVRWTGVLGCATTISFSFRLRCCRVTPACVGASCHWGWYISSFGRELLRGSEMRHEGSLIDNAPSRGLTRASYFAV